MNSSYNTTLSRQQKQKSTFPRQSSASSWTYSQTSFDSSISISSSSSTVSSSNSNIFTILNQSNSITPTSISSNPSAYIHHSNLDVRPLSIADRFRLARVQYVTIPNGIRTVILSLCICWFIYAMDNVYSDFKNYPTIVKLEYVDPSTSKPPAITVCTHCVLCSYRNETLKEISAWKILTEDDVQIKPQKSTANTARHNDIKCTLYPDTLRHDWEKYSFNCTDLVPKLLSMQEGHKCITYFSDIFGQLTRAANKNVELTLNFDKAPKIRLEIGGDYVSGIVVTTVSPNGVRATSFSGMYINIHDPTILPDMYGLPFHQLMPGYRTNILFVKRIEHLLPPQCYHYRSKADTNYSTTKITKPLVQSRTRGECFNHCLWNQLNKNKCENFYSIYTAEMLQMENTTSFTKDLLDIITSSQVISMNSNLTILDADAYFKICPRTIYSFFEYAHYKQYCMEYCPKSCKTVTFEDVGIIDYKDSQAKDQVAYAEIKWAPRPVTKIDHLPRFSLEDVLGTIGGHAHVILGLSVLSSIWFVIKFVQSNE